MNKKSTKEEFDSAFSGKTNDEKYNNLFDTERRIIRWPKKNEEKLFVLKYLQSKFETGRKYNEREVNETLMEWHLFNDFALLRREMYNNYFINRTRDCREYWIEEKKN
jgi:hypothetical protein